MYFWYSDTSMKILLIEDDQIFAEGVRKILAEKGLAVDIVNEGDKALRRILVNKNAYDVIILDIMLDNVDGKEVCRALREENVTTPIIILSAKTDPEEKVKALNVGADDYITKPFSGDELFARIQALLRRPKELNADELVVAGIRLDPQTRKVYKDGKVIELTLKEFSVLEYLMRHPDQVLARDQILDHSWEFNFSSFSNIIDVHINGIRKKMNMKKNEMLETVHGVGYRLKDIFNEK